MALNASRSENEENGAKKPAVKSVLDAAAVLEQTERILSDPQFQYSKRSSDLLSYIVKHSLEGQHEFLKERIIGLEVFGRSPDYDTGLDSIVRVAANEVRKRLFRYYEKSGRESELRIQLPTRSYVATFGPSPSNLKIDQSLPQIVHESPPEKAHQSPSRVRHFRKLWLGIPISIPILIATVWFAQHLYHPSRAIDRFWSPILSSGAPAPVLISIPPPTSMDFAKSNSGPEIPLSKFISEQANFPVVDLSAANAIASFLSLHGRGAAIRLSASITLADLHRVPVIVLGGSFNEWGTRLGANLPFHFRRDESSGLRWIEDVKHPGSRTWQVNLNSPYEQVANEYVLITRVSDPITGQHWVGIGGTTVLGTTAGQQMLTDRADMEAIAAQWPKGWENANLQTVIQIKMVEGSLGASTVVAMRTW